MRGEDGHSMVWSFSLPMDRRGYFTSLHDCHLTISVITFSFFRHPVTPTYNCPRKQFSAHFDIKTTSPFVIHILFLTIVYLASSHSSWTTNIPVRYRDGNCRLHWILRVWNLPGEVVFTRISPCKPEKDPTMPWLSTVVGWRVPPR